MADVIGYTNISFGARVEELETSDGHIKIRALGSDTKDFDRVILTIPPAALRMINIVPPWGWRKRVAIRSMHFVSLYKMGLRFKTRFWERMMHSKSKGGQSTTDLPIRWLVFPSNGIGAKGPGVLLMYAWNADAMKWSPLSHSERRRLALKDIATMYRMEDRCINDLLIETSDKVWSESTATGTTMFLPGQFHTTFNEAREHEGNIYFAGEHLSYHHSWISGAAYSAMKVVRDMLGKQGLSPLEF